MKNIKNLTSCVAILMIAMFSLTLVSCGGGEDDPKPVTPKTDLEKVQEAIAGSTWTLQSAVVVANDITYNYAGDCNFNDFPSALVATNTTDFTYTFAGSTLSYAESCGSQTGSNKAYTITQDGSTFTLEYTHGSSQVKFKLKTPVSEITGNTVEVERLTLYGGATSATLTFSK